MDVEEEEKPNKVCVVIGFLLGLALIVGVAVAVITVSIRYPDRAKRVAKNMFLSNNDKAILKKISNKETSVSAHGKTYVQRKDGIYELNGPVMDTANVLSEEEYNELDSFLRNLDDTTGVQIAVLTVQTLDGEDIESFSIKHAQSWHLGQKGVDNGALLTVAMEEHGLRIETGYGTEGTLTDAKCAQLIRNVLTPAFRSGDYGEGIVSCVKNMAGIITSNKELVTVQDDEATDGNGAVSSDNDGMWVIWAVAILLLIFFIYFIATRIAIVHYPYSKFAMWAKNASESNGSSDSGGGSFSGGGGSFGGGGASGSW